VSQSQNNAGQKPEEPKLPPTVIEILAEEESRDNRLFRWSMGIALVLHLVFFWMHWPSFAGASADSARQKTKIFVVKQVRFKQPPKQELQQIPKPKMKMVPIPDPTPDQPEPLREEEPQRDIDFVPDDNLVLGVPDAPPPPEPEGPVRFVAGGNITEPVKINAPQPKYPEAARRAKMQGVVVLECTISKQGNVEDVKVLRGLPLGLTESAVDAVNKWKFKPSTLNGRPVEVIYVLTVRFTLQ
jgi:periplasmic protein TonB